MKETLLIKWMMMPQERMQQQVAGESQTEYEKKVT